MTTEAKEMYESAPKTRQAEITQMVAQPHSEQAMQEEEEAEEQDKEKEEGDEPQGTDRKRASLIICDDKGIYVMRKKKGTESDSGILKFKGQSDNHRAAEEAMGKAGIERDTITEIQQRCRRKRWTSEGTASERNIWTWQAQGEMGQARIDKSLTHINWADIQGSQELSNQERRIINQGTPPREHAWILRIHGAASSQKGAEKCMERATREIKEIAESATGERRKPDRNMGSVKQIRVTDDGKVKLVVYTRRAAAITEALQARGRRLEIDGSIGHYRIELIGDKDTETHTEVAGTKTAAEWRMAAKIAKHREGASRKEEQTRNIEGWELSEVITYMESEQQKLPQGRSQLRGKARRVAGRHVLIYEPRPEQRSDNAVGRQGYIRSEYPRRQGDTGTEGSMELMEGNESSEIRIEEIQESMAMTNTRLAEHAKQGTAGRVIRIMRSRQGAEAGVGKSPQPEERQRHPVDEAIPSPEGRADDANTWRTQAEWNQRRDEESERKGQPSECQELRQEDSEYESSGDDEPVQDQTAKRANELICDPRCLRMEPKQAADMRLAYRRHKHAQEQTHPGKTRHIRGGQSDKGRAGRISTPFYTIMHVGSRDNPNKRIRVKVMWDSGCSLNVMSSRLRDKLKEVTTDDQWELPKREECPQARCAYGQKKQSNERAQLGATAPNSSTKKGDIWSKEFSINNVWVFEGLQADLIIGTPGWEGVVQGIDNDRSENGWTHDTIRMSMEPEQREERGDICIPVNTTNTWNPEDAVLGVADESARAPWSQDDGRWQRGGASMVRIALQTNNLHETAPRDILCLPLEREGWGGGQEINAEGQPGKSRGFTIEPQRCEVTPDDAGGYSTQVRVTWTHTTAGVSPGTPMVKILRWQTHDWEVREARWMNPHIEHTKQEELRSGVMRVAAEMTNEETPINKMIRQAWNAQEAKEWKEGPGLDIMAERLHAQDWIKHLLRTDVMREVDDPDQVALTLTGIAQMMEAMPHVTEAMAHTEINVARAGSSPRKHGLARIMTEVKRRPKQGWEAAQVASKRIWQLVRADRAGMRKGETNDAACINEDGSIRWDNIQDQQGQDIGHRSAWRWLNLDTEDERMRWEAKAEETTEEKPPELNEFSNRGWDMLTTQGWELNAERDAENRIRKVTWNKPRGEKRDERGQHRRVITAGLTTGPEANTMREEAASMMKKIRNIRRDEAKKRHEDAITKVESETTEEKDALRCKTISNDLKSAEKANPSEFLDNGTVDIDTLPTEEQPDELGGDRCYLGPEGKAPNPDITLKDKWWGNLQEGELLKNLWDADEGHGGLSDGHKRYIAAIEWGDGEELIASKEGATEAETAKTKQENRAIIHSAIILLGIAIRDTWFANPWDPGFVDGAIFSEEFLTLVTNQSIYDAPRPLPAAALDQAKEMVDEQIRIGMCCLGSSPYSHNVLVVPKKADKDGKVTFRWVNDTRKLNSQTLRTNFRLLPTWTTLEQAAGHDWYVCSDCTDGYRQVRADSALFHKMSFTTGTSDRISPCRCIMGILNASSCFVMAVARCISPLLSGCCELCERNRFLRAHRKVATRMEEEMTAQEGTMKYCEECIGEPKLPPKRERHQREMEKRGAETQAAALTRRQAAAMPQALAEMRDGRKTTHWMWWGFPTDKIGGNEPVDELGNRTKVTEETAAQVMEGAPEAWQEMITAAAKAIKEKGLKEVFPEARDRQRLRGFVTFWDRQPSTQATWLKKSIEDLIGGGVTKEERREARNPSERVHKCNSCGFEDSTIEDTAANRRDGITQVTRGKLRSWIRRSKAKHPIQDGEVQCKTWDTCRGVPMEDNSHRARGVAYVDDVLACLTGSSGTWEGNSKFKQIMESLIDTRGLLDQLDTHGISLKAMKTTMLTRSLEFLGWTLTSGGLLPGSKGKAWAKCHRPRNKKEVEKALGSIQFYKKAVEAEALFEGPLRDLIKAGVEWKWEKKHQDAWEQLKHRMTSDAIMTSFDPNGGEISITVDASTTGVGCVCSQKQANGEERPIAYASTRFGANQTKLSAVQREFMGLIFALEQFKETMYMRRTRVYMDAKVVIEALKKSQLSAKMHRMALKVQQHDLVFTHRNGRDIPVADFLSRANASRPLFNPNEGETPDTGDKRDRPCDMDEELEDRQRCYGAAWARARRLAGPRKGQEDEKRPLTQPRRRLARHLMEEAIRVHEKGLQGLKLDEAKIAIMKEALAAGEITVTEADEGATRKIPRSAHEQIEEQAMRKLGGTEEVLKMIMEEDKLEALMEEFRNSEHDLTQRLHLKEYEEIDKTGKKVLKNRLRIWAADPAETDKTTAEVMAEAEVEIEDGNEEGAFVTTLETETIEAMTHFMDSTECKANHKEMSTTDGKEKQQEEWENKGLTRDVKMIVTREDLDANQTRYKMEIEEDSDIDSDIDGDEVNAMTNDNESKATQHCRPILVDQFAGVGVGAQGFREQGFDIGTVCEKGDAQVRALQQRYNDSDGARRVIRDIRSVKKRHLQGAFTTLSSSPCPAFSKSGHKGGWLDKRSYYFDSQCKAAIEAEVATIIVENVEEVARSMQGHETHGTISPLDALIKQLEPKYITEWRIMDSGKMGGFTRRPRAILQAKLKTLAEDTSQERGKIEARLKEAWEQMCKNEGMDAAKERWEDHFDISMAGFVWAIEGNITKEQHANKIMERWEDVPDEYKLSKRRWHEFDQRDDARSGAHRVGIRWSENNDIGKIHDPNRLLSSKGLVAGLTAFGNSGWYLTQTSAGRMGIRRLTGEEFLKTMGVTGRHELKPGSFSERDMCEMAGNAITAHLSQRLAVAAKSYYDSAWHTKHVQNIWSKEGRTWDETALEEDMRIWKQGSTDEEWDMGNEDMDVNINEGEGLQQAWQRTNKEGIRVHKRLQHLDDLWSQHRMTSLTKQYSPSATEAVTTKAGTSLRGGTGSVQHRVEVHRLKRGAEARVVTEESPEEARREVSEILRTGEKGAWRELRERQREDIEFKVIAEFAETGKLPSNPLERHYLHQKEEYLTKEGILYRVNREGKGAEAEYKLQLVVPRSMQFEITKRYHEKLGHIKSRSLCATLQEKYWWPCILRDCITVVAACEKCERYADLTPSTGRMNYTETTEERSRPGDAIYMDILGPYSSSATEQGYRYLLAVEDDFTRYIALFPMKVIDSENVADRIEQYASQFGWPLHVKSDRASNFIGGAMSCLYKRWGVRKSHSAAIHPEGHSRIERVNRHIQKSLRTTLDGNPEWCREAHAMAQAWNCTAKRMLGHVSPFYLMFGRAPRFGFDEPNPDVNDKFSTVEWVKDKIGSLKRRWQLVSDGLAGYKLEILYQARQRWKEKPATEIQPGAQVRIHLPVVSGKGTASKLAARWSEAYTVIGRAMGGKALNTYIVKKLHNSKATSVPIHVSRIRVMTAKGETMPRITMTGEMEMAGEIAEETSDAILGMTEPAGEENATRKKRIERLLRFRARGEKEPLLGSEAEATDMLERWSRELERRPGENEEVTLAPQELVEIYSGKGTPHTTTSTTDNNTDERDALDEGVAEGVRRQTGRNKQGERGGEPDTTSEKATNKAKKRQRKKDNSTFPFKAVTRIKTIGAIAKKWGMQARELIDLNRPFMMRGNDKEFPMTASDRIRNGTKLRVPKEIQEGEVTAEKLGDKGMIWAIKETPYYVDRQEVATSGVAVTQRHYLVVWDDTMLEQNEELWSWVEAGELEVADRVIQEAEGESSREAAETKLKERMGITDEKEGEINQLEESRESLTERPDTNTIAAMHRANDGTTKHILIRCSQISTREDVTQPKGKKWYEWQSKSVAGEARWRRAEAEFPITKRATTGDTVEWKEHSQRSKAEISAIQTMSDFRGKISPNAGWTEVARVVANRAGEVRWLTTPQDNAEQQQEDEVKGKGEEEPEAKRFERIAKQGAVKASQDKAVTERLEMLAEAGTVITQVLDLQNISSTMSKTQIMWTRAAIIKHRTKVVILGGAKSVKQGLWDMLKEVATQTEVTEIRSRSDQDDEGRSKNREARTLEKIVRRNKQEIEGADIPEEERHLWQARKMQPRESIARLAKEFKGNWTDRGERGQDVRRKAIDVISNACNVRKGGDATRSKKGMTVQQAGERVGRILEIISGDNPSGDTKQSKAQRQGFLEPEATELAIQRIKEYKGEENTCKESQETAKDREGNDEEEQVTNINILLWRWPMTGQPQIAVTEEGRIPNRGLTATEQPQRGSTSDSKKVISKIRKMAKGIIADESGAPMRDLAGIMYEDMHGNMAQDDVRKGSTQRHGNTMTQSWTVTSTAAAAQITEEGRMTWINAEDAPINEQTLREAIRRREQARTRVITANTAKSHEGAIIVTRRPEREDKGCGLTAAITIPQGTMIGNLMWGTNRITEQEKRRAETDKTWDDRRVFHRYRQREGGEEDEETQEEGEGKQPRERNGTKVYYTPTSRSSPAWFINHSKEQPNCKIEENGNIRTQRTVWRGESLEADYSKLTGGRKHKQLRAGDAGDDTRGAHQDTEARQALCEWNPDGDIKEAWSLMKRVLSEHEATTGEVTGIGHMDATGNAPDLFSVLTALKATKLSDQDKQWARATEGDNSKRRANIPQLARSGENIRELILTTFEAATDNLQERKKILEEEERAADDPDSYLYTAEVTSLDAAQQYLAVFHQRFGTNKAKVFEKDETIYRFHKALTFVTEKAERNKNQETPVAGIEVHFPMDFSTTREFEAFITPRQIKTMGIRIVDKPEVKVIMQDEGGNRISRMGMVVKMMGKDANRRTLIIATRWTDDMSHNKTVEMVPMVRSPTGQRIRMALDTIYEEEVDETEEDKEGRAGMDRKLRAGVKKRMNATFESIRAILRGDNPEARKGADARERAYEAVNEWENQLTGKLTEGQASAVKMAYQNKISVIQGPPGAGKSTVLRHIIQRVAWYNKKQPPDTRGQTLVTSGGNKVVQDWVRALSTCKHPDGTPLQIAWHVSASYGHRVPDDLKKYTVEEMALYQPEGYTEPMENRTSHARLAQLHKLEKEGKASPEESKLYEGLMKKAQEGVIKTAQVLLMTASQCGVKKITTRKFEIVAVDEASQITELAMFQYWDCKRNQSY